MGDTQVWVKPCPDDIDNDDRKRTKQPGDEGQPQRASAAQVSNDDPSFWTRLGKLYVSILVKPDRAPEAAQVARLNEIFKKAADHADDDPAVLKDVADYYASTQQIKLAIPLYLRLLELAPEDTNAREKLATGFVLTNQRDKAVEMLQEIIQHHPEKYQDCKPPCSCRSRFHCLVLLRQR